MFAPIDAPHEVRRRQAQGMGNTDNVEQADVPLAPLDAADIRTMKARDIGQGLLRQAGPLSLGPDASSESPKDRVFHGNTFGEMMPIRRQTISSY